MINPVDSMVIQWKPIESAENLVGNSTGNLLSSSSNNLAAKDKVTLPVYLNTDREILLFSIKASLGGDLTPVHAYQRAIAFSCQK
jgi:hypothetical protein